MLPALKLEICVDSPEGLAAAVAGGADRIELCSALDLGGLTPGPGLVAAAMACNVPCHAMIRPRAGDFVLRHGDLEAMLADVAFMRASGLAGVVLGVSRADGALDEMALGQLIAAAQGMSLTLHRAFDLAPEPMAALEAAMRLGFDRILTSGQHATAMEGADLLARLVASASGRIEIMAGGGVTPSQAPALLATGVQALHGSCSVEQHSAQDCSRIGISQRRVTQASTVAALKAAMNAELARA